MDSNNRYTFENFSDQPYDGMMGGVPYHFEPGETKEFDADKHGMLVVMAKHLADREILKGVKGVGRDPNNQETWGKSLDENDKPFVMTSDLRKEYIRKAVGWLVDTPVPIPEEQQEAGGTQGTEKTAEEVTSLKGEVKDLKEMIASLTSQVGKLTSVPQAAPSPSQPAESPAETTAPLAREAILELAKDKGIEVTPTMTKAEILAAIAAKK